jgi:hypothetical protein
MSFYCFSHDLHIEFLGGPPADGADRVVQRVHLVNVGRVGVIDTRDMATDLVTDSVPTNLELGETDK